MNCCICGDGAGKHGHSAEPVAKGRCCNECNAIIVLPTRALRAKAMEKIKNAHKTRQKKNT